MFDQLSLLKSSQLAYNKIYRYIKIILWYIYNINISIESFKLLLKEINQIKNKNFFIIIIIRDALFSIGASNEEIANQDLHLCDTDTENFFSSLIDGCLKYKNKEKHKIGPKPGPRGVKKIVAQMQGSTAVVHIVQSLSWQSFNVFKRSLLYSLRLHLFDQKYRKNYSKQLFFLIGLIHLKI